MKTCTKCLVPKDDDQFNFKNKSTGLRTTICKDCFVNIRRKDYEKNKARYLERISNNKASNRKWFDELKLTLSCKKCGENHPATLDFHHNDPSKKEATVSSLSGQTYSKDRVLDEIQKCTVLCSNCHRKFHWMLKNKIISSIDQFLNSCKL